MLIDTLQMAITKRAMQPLQRLWNNEESKTGPTDLEYYGLPAPHAAG
jgi:hypothetical protein